MLDIDSIFPVLGILRLHACMYIIWTSHTSTYHMTYDTVVLYAYRILVCDMHVPSPSPRTSNLAGRHLVPAVHACTCVHVHVRGL